MNLAVAAGVPGWAPAGDADSGLAGPFVIILLFVLILAVLPPEATSGTWRRLALRSRLNRFLTGRMTNLAAALAGRRRAVDAEAWRAHLLGDPEAGTELTRAEQWKAALGFLVAAARMRGRDLCRVPCRPLDWIVASETRVAWFVLTAGVAACVSLHQHGGWARIWSDFEQVGVLVCLCSGAAYAWRRLRGITTTARAGSDEDMHVEKR